MSACRHLERPVANNCHLHTCGDTCAGMLHHFIELCLSAATYTYCYCSAVVISTSSCPASLALCVCCSLLQEAPLHHRVQAPCLYTSVWELKGWNSLTVHANVFESLNLSNICDQIVTAALPFSEGLDDCSYSFIMSSYIVCSCLGACSSQKCRLETHPLCRAGSVRVCLWLLAVQACMAYAY